MEVEGREAIGRAANCCGSRHRAACRACLSPGRGSS